MVGKLGILRRLQLEDVWSTDLDFSGWICQNLPMLPDLLGMDLETLKIEPAFLVAYDLNSGRNVLIERGHRCKKSLEELMSAAAGFDVEVIITFFTAAHQKNHREMIDGLNKDTQNATEVYGVVVDVLQIDNSRPAINFILVAYP